MQSLKEGYLVTFVGSWAESKGYIGKFFRILLKERLLYITNEGDTTEFTAVAFTTVATPAESDWKDIEALEPATNELYVVRVGVRDGCKYHLKLTGKERMGPALDTDMAYFTNQDSLWTKPSEELELILVHDMFPTVNAVNATGSDITPKLYFKGEQYQYEEAEEYSPTKKPAKKPAEFSTITLGGKK